LPEQLSQKGQAKLQTIRIVPAAAAAAAARWSTGVLAYELVAGAPPFMHEDRMVMYRRIVDGVFSCPTHFSAVSALQRCVQFVNGLQNLNRRVLIYRVLHHATHLSAGSIPVLPVQITPCLVVRAYILLCNYTSLLPSCVF
jgi:hypothetical protein